MTVQGFSACQGWEHESEAGEHFADWIEQFELVASVYHWDDHTKLVNLTTRLRS